MLQHEALTEKIIACAIEVHKYLGPGLLESAYEECYRYELKLKNLFVERQKPYPWNTRGLSWIAVIA